MRHKPAPKPMSDDEAMELARIAVRSGLYARRPRRQLPPTETTKETLTISLNTSTAASLRRFARQSGFGLDELADVAVRRGICEVGDEMVAFANDARGRRADETRLGAVMAALWPSEPSPAA